MVIAHTVPVITEITFILIVFVKLIISNLLLRLNVDFVTSEPGNQFSNTLFLNAKLGILALYLEFLDALGHIVSFEGRNLTKRLESMHRSIMIIFLNTSTLLTETCWTHS